MRFCWAARGVGSTLWFVFTDYVSADMGLTWRDGVFVSPPIAADVIKSPYH
jgi:hypothetical protein